MKRFIGRALMIVGGVAILAGAVAFLDPVATKMADDGDPFGTPISRYESAAIAASAIAGCLLGRSLLSAAHRK